MIKVAHARIDEQTGLHFAVLVGPDAHSLKAGQCLRCAAYRFNIHQVVSSYPEAPNPTVGVLLQGFDEPVDGMVLHLVSEPLTREELAAAIRHLAMVPRMLKSFDAAGVVTALDSATFDTPELQRVARVARVVRDLALELSRIELPFDVQMREVARYIEDVLARC